MSNLKVYYTIAKLTLKGYSEDNAQEEMYLHGILRTSDDIKLYELICITLANHGGLFNIPTLMALSKESGQKGILALNALSGIRRRITPDKAEEIAGFFTPEFWQPVWKGSKENFLTYIACLANVIADHPFDTDVMDSLAVKITKEIRVDLSPYETFQELRLLSPDWDIESGVKRVLQEVNEAMALSDALSITDIAKNPDSQKEENLVNMRCDYLITRLKLGANYDQLHYMLRVADTLNR